MFVENNGPMSTPQDECQPGNKQFSNINKISQKSAVSLPRIFNKYSTDRGILYKTPLSNVYINVQIEVYYFQTDLYMYMYVNVNGVLYKIPLIVLEALG